MLELEERVDSLEAMFERFIINSDNILRRLEKMMIDMRQQAEQDRRELNKKWGELANRLGIVAEDIVAPNLPRLAR